MVWGKGRIDSGILVVGEAPGKEENKAGVPFVGADILDKAFGEAGLSYKGSAANCYITSALACRPCNSKRGKSRAPEETEIANCRNRIHAILRAGRPSLILLLGDHAKFSFFNQTVVPTISTHYGITIYTTVAPEAYRQKDWRMFWRRMKQVVCGFKHRDTTVFWELPI